MSECGPQTFPVEAYADAHLTSLEERLVEEHVRGHFPRYVRVCVCVCMYVYMYMYVYI